MFIGGDYSPEEGPDPKLSGWYDVWSAFGEAHDTESKDGSHYTAAATDHRGIGGCGSHDTRITYQLREVQKETMAKMMGWDVPLLNMYYQTALNLIPLHRSLELKDDRDPIYNKIIEALYTKSHSNHLKNVCNNKDGEYEHEYKTIPTLESVGEVSMAMYGDSGLRWSSAYLVHKDVRPKNLKVLRVWRKYYSLMNVREKPWTLELARLWLMV